MRGFTLDGFLSDYEEPGSISPWVIGNEGWVNSKQKEPDPAPPQGTKVPSAVQLAAAAGMQQKLKVLYVSDYISSARRSDFSARLYRELSLFLPGYDVSIGLADGPFEDDQGTSSRLGATYPLL